MEFVRRAERLAPKLSSPLFALLTLWLLAASAGAQVFLGGPTSRFELSESVRLDEADSAAKTHLERAKAFLAHEQWDEAVETLRQVGENHGGKVVGISPRRYISVRDYCHLQIAGLPAEALALYRSRVDPQARHWYDEGVRRRKAEPLLNVVEQLFASTSGDDALYALGEIALEQGDYGRARGYWERIVPPWYWAKVAPPESQPEGTPVWLVYPDTDLDLAGVLARLVLVSIMEGERETARRQLQAFSQEYGAAQGRLGGRDVHYVEMLTNLLDESAAWPAPPSSDDWVTFGGSVTRTKPVANEVEVGAPQWRQRLPKAPAANFGYSPRRVAEQTGELLSYHPLIVDDMVLLSVQEGDQYQILAFDLKTGQPAWSDDPVIYRDLAAGSQPRRNGRTTLGAARFTLTAHDHRLYARLGNPVTSSPQDTGGRAELGYLVCLDLASQGRLLWRVTPPDETWAFEGSPVTDGTDVYVAMRKADVHEPQAHVACLDGQSGQMRWRRFVCAAETPTQGQSNEITHNLLTLEQGMLYYNTNLGAVAALAAADGQVQWIYLYLRAKAGDLTQRAKHFYRDLTPCIYDRGVVYVAPSDTPHVMAINASSGLLVWSSHLPEDTVHLLGTGGGNLLASGDKLWWIDKATGKIAHRPWPDGPTPKGYGRGILAGSKVYWPTRTMIYVFDQRTGQQQRQPLELTQRGATGGNLLIARDRLLIVTSGDKNDELIAFSPHGGPREIAGETASP